MRDRDQHAWLGRHWPALVGGLVAVVILLGLLGTCAPETTVNTELARATRQAVESATEARRNNDAAYLWPGRLRMIAMALGVGIPIVMAVVLVYLTLKRRPEDLELIDYLDTRRRALEQRDDREALDAGNLLGRLAGGRHSRRRRNARPRSRR